MQRATSAGCSAPGVARTKTAPVRLRSALVRRSRQACGRTAPSSSAMCSSVRDFDQFRRDTNYELGLNVYNTSLLPKQPRGHCPPFSSTTPHVIQKKNIPACVSRRDAFDERVPLFANLPRGLVGSKNSDFPSLWALGNTRIRLSAIDLLGKPLSPRP